MHYRYRIIDHALMRLHFTKMHGAGNDFIVIDATRIPFGLSRDTIRTLTDRRFGIGCDQVLVIENPRTPGTDFFYRIFNADGAEVQHCGNGARCFLKFVHDHGLTTKPEIKVETVNGLIVPKLGEDGRVTVDMGAPILDPKLVPFEAPGHAITYHLDLPEVTREIGVLSMGNPHAVQVVDDVDTAPVGTEGPLIEGHTRFPERVNAGFMQIVDRHSIRLRVYERGSGETLSCGTGACAAVASGILRGLLESPVDVQTRGGVLSIAWGGEGSHIMMTGPATTVFEGDIELPDQPQQTQGANDALAA